MMTRKTRLAMIGFVLLLLLLLIAWLWFFLSSRRQTLPEESEVAPTAKEEIVELGSTVQEQQLAQEQEGRNQAASVTTVAKSFTERYGSYSNEAKFQNLLDLFPLMTAAFVEKTKGFIENSSLPDSYYGVTTRVLTVTVEQLNEQAGEAIILMQTQREMGEGSTQNTKVSYQEIRLTLKQEAKIWKVDSADWL